MATAPPLHSFRCDDLTGVIIRAATKVYARLGRGLAESVYRTRLADELRSRGYDVLTEATYPVDLVVENRIIVGVSSANGIYPIHEDQLLCCLRFSGIRVGLLINFNVDHLWQGIKRMVDNGDGKA